MSHFIASIQLFTDLGRGLREGFFMFWETLWALVLGFTLSGVVQAFVPKEKMQAKLGNHGPAAIIRASGYGMASSSCSYAASAMTKSLFVKGADFVSAMVFMIASTNLVVELGIVMLILLGWQFMVAEFIGGPIMITIIALAGGFVFTKVIVQRARTRLAQPQVEHHDHDVMVGVSAERQAELENAPWSKKLGSTAAWSDASSYAVADVTMLRKELAIGYIVAGFLAALVPTHLWNALFLHGHGFWTIFENSLVGPLIAVLSWVCSIGNVPLAAALWSGGISFGGVIAFIFADLIAMPLILIYRKFYGTKLTLRLVGLFYVAMALAGLATEGIFYFFGAIPTRHSINIAHAHLQWNYTTFLNIIFIAVAVAVWWLARNRTKFGGGGTGYAIDPVCAMQVRSADAPAKSQFDGVTYHFCSDRCKERFDANSERFVGKGASPEAMDPSGTDSTNRGTNPRIVQVPGAIDPICGMTVDPATAAAHRQVGGKDYWFCGTGCATSFDTSGSQPHDDDHHESG